ncbi:hypothetical protein ACHAWF_019023 [Thalassiosira exigua]
MRNPSLVHGDGETNGDVLELGSGCGLAGLTAASMLERGLGDDKVFFTDYNREVLDNLKRNVELNDVAASCDVVGLDWFDQSGDETSTSTWLDMDGGRHERARLIIGADLIVCSNDAELVANTIDSALVEGGRAVIMSPTYNRFGVDAFPDACRLLGLTCVTAETDESELMKSLDTTINDYSTSAMAINDYSTFTVTKPIAVA